MPASFPSEAWAIQLVDALSSSAPFMQAATGWTPGLLALVVDDGGGAEASDARGAVRGLAPRIGQAVTFVLDARGPQQGRCVPAGAALQDAACVLAASRATWQALLSGQRDPVKALMGGDVKVRAGGLPAVVGRIFAYAELMKVAASLS